MRVGLSATTFRSSCQIGKELKYSIDERSLYLLFSPQIIDIISNFTFNQKLNFDTKQYHNHFLYDNLSYSKSKEPINPLLIKEKLLCPFLKLYYDKELGARRIVKRLKKEAFTDTQYTENLLQTFDITDNWSCEDITIGKWDSQIQQKLDESDVIIYMLSANFFSSSYILEREVQNVMEGKRDKKSILCVIVSDFVDLNKLETQLQSWQISDKQKAILMLKDFQYLPYGKEFNNVTKQNEEKIMSLKHFANNADIETALKQISEKVLNIL